MFDFGGHVGVSYHGWRNYLGYEPGMRWMVYDMPAIVKVGAELARERPSTGLEFTSDLADGKGCTVLMAAGAMQYADLTLTGLLDAVGARPAHLLLNKMPVYDGECILAVQSTGRAFHPTGLQPRRAGRGGAGPRVSARRRLAEPRAALRDSFTRGRDIDAYSGFYFVKV